MTKHALKVWPEFFHPLMSGEKTFEIRKNDRYFKVDDTLHLQEWDPARNIYTGREIWKRVTYVTDFPAGIREGYVVMGLAPAPALPADSPKYQARLSGLPADA